MLLRAVVRYPRLAREQWLPAATLRRLQWQRLQATLRHAFARLAVLSPPLRGARHHARRHPRPSRLRAAAGHDPRGPAVARGPARPRLRRGASLKTRHDLRLDRPAHHDLFRSRRLVRRQASPQAARAARLRHAADRPGRPVPGGAVRSAGRRAWAAGRAPSRSTRRRRALIEDVARFGPDILYGFPGHLLLLGAGRARQAPAAADLHLGRAAGRGDPRSDRGAVRRPSLRRLRLDRGKEIAWECPERSGYHINADWLLVEAAAATDAQGRTTQPDPGDQPRSTARCR